MSLENVHAFRQRVSDDTRLQTVISASLSAGDISQIVELGGRHGFDFSKEELKQVFVDDPSRELSDFELELVAGGAASYLQTKDGC
jgi:predicted ribosomally synthesized peptide with nif11-like leader